MKHARLFFLSAAIITLSPSLMGFPQATTGGPQQPDIKLLEVQKLKENLFVIKGGGGNTTVFITGRGVVVVDAKNPGWGTVLLAKIKTITDRPVIALINTHSHQDHTGGDADFPPGIDIIAQENTKKNMETMDIFKSGKGLPTKTFKNRMTLFSGQDRINLYYFGPGGTSGDTWVVFPALRTMAAGDGCSGRHLSIVSNPVSGGKLAAFPDTLSKMLASIKNVDTVIPGHDDVMTWNDLKVYADFYRDFLNWIEAERKSGKSVDEAVAAYQVPAKYTAQGYTPGVERAVRVNIQGVYDELGNQTR